MSTAGSSAIGQEQPSETQFRLNRVYITRLAIVIAVLGYAVLIAFLYALNQKVDRLEHKAAALELDNARLQRRVEILNVVEDFQRGFSKAEVAELASVIDKESDRYGIDPLLVLSVILTETDFKRYQVSPKGAMGLMQIRPFVARDLALRRGIAWNDDVGLFDPMLNVKLGTTYLFELILQFNDITHALAAYGHGEARLRRDLRLGRPAPKTYTKRVMRRYNQLVAHYRDQTTTGG